MGTGVSVQVCLCALTCSKSLCVVVAVLNTDISLGSPTSGLWFQSCSLV